MNERLKQLRSYFKLSQAEFADKLFISQNHLSRLESGKSIITERLIKNICDTFEINENWFRNGTGTMFVKKQISKDAEINLMLDKFKKLNKVDQDRIEKIIDSFLN